MWIVRLILFLPACPLEGAGACAFSGGHIAFFSLPLHAFLGVLEPAAFTVPASRPHLRNVPLSLVVHPVRVYLIQMTPTLHVFLFMLFLLYGRGISYAGVWPRSTPAD
ncbi:hypothetical protein BD779DRAFT_1551239 [Infundibulicybe gibba]|nr:hypothetical protein BD779DRAFT_1551239 [Infundibulicybe gibba]